MLMLSFALLVLFVFCGLFYARASKQLNAFDKLRLEKEPPPIPDSMLHSATQFARKMGVPLAPGNDELKAFCERQGLGADYKRANRMLFGSILVALVCAYAIIRLGPIQKPGQPPAQSEAAPKPKP
jgi:hypothetical protein